MRFLSNVLLIHANIFCVTIFINKIHGLLLHVLIITGKKSYNNINSINQTHVNINTYLSVPTNKDKVYFKISSLFFLKKEIIGIFIKFYLDLL